jgi:hypothetical protein
MISGQRFLRLWYYHGQDYPEFDLERLFPNSGYMGLVSKPVGERVVEKEQLCLPNARVLLAKIETLTDLTERDGDAIRIDIERRCRVCGIRTYCLVADQGTDATIEFGIRPAMGRSFKIFVCNHCGHSQLFAFRVGLPLDAFFLGHSLLS